MAQPTKETPEFIFVDMRTKFSVSMARKDSNITDEDALESVVTTQIPSQPVTSTICEASMLTQSALRTPPLSNSRRQNERPNPPFTPVLGGKENSGTQGRVSLNPKVGRSPVAVEMAGGRASASTNARNPYDALSIEHIESQRIQRRTALAGYDGGSSQEAIPSTLVRNYLTPPHRPTMGNQWSQAIQTFLIKTPPRGVERAVPSERGSASANQTSCPSRKRSTAAPESLRRKSQRTRPVSIGPISHASGDPREHLINYKRSVARGKYPARARSVKLPLETMLRGMSTCALTMELEVSSTDFRQKWTGLGSLTTGRLQGRVSMLLVSRTRLISPPWRND